MKIIKNKHQSERSYWRRLTVKQKHCAAGKKHHLDDEMAIWPKYTTDSTEVLLARGELRGKW